VQNSLYTIILKKYQGFNMAIIKMVQTEQELKGLKGLQNANLRRLIGEEEAMKEGFVTSEYSLELLEKMHQEHPSIIAKEGDEVVGYVIVTNKSVLGEHDEIDHLFHTVDEMEFNGELLKNCTYILVGQLCVGKSHRGQGLVQAMYTYYKENFSQQYQYLVTDISQANPRSIKAHKKSGFETIGVIEQVGTGWDIVLWNWNK
jgi:RimJ/RimL family protein N-acetyltransferase